MECLYSYYGYQDSENRVVILVIMECLYNAPPIATRARDVYLFSVFPELYEAEL